MRGVSADKMRALDRRAIEEFGIPALCLMENAGRAVAEEAVRHLRRSGKKRAGILCGTGNNGGDGFVAARHLWNAGLCVTVFLAGDPVRFSPEAAINFRILQKLKIPLRTVVSLKALQAQDVLIDALLGIGLDRNVDGLLGDIIRRVNDSRCPVIAVDVPSGLDATTGRVWGVGVKAKKTVTLAVAKQGMFLREGPRYCGKVVVADIGIPVFRAKR